MDNRKAIVTFHITIGLIAWFLTRSTFQFLFVTFYQVRRLPMVGVAREAVPFLIGITAFIILLKHARANAFLEEAVSELKKVTLPNRQDVVRSTTVVIICIFVASVILATFDLLWGQVISYLLHS